MARVGARIFVARMRIVLFDQTFNGMPAPEMSRIVNFLLLYLIPWDDLGCEIQRFAHRFDMYAEAIVDKGCALNVINRRQRDKPQIVTSPMELSMNVVDQQVTATRA